MSGKQTERKKKPGRAEPGDKGVENLTATSRKNAWIAVLNEMVNARRSTSLASLGIIKFNYKGNTEEIMSGVAEAYQQKVEDVKALFDLLAMEVVYHGALEGDCDLTDDEREYIFIRKSATFLPHFYWNVALDIYLLSPKRFEKIPKFGDFLTIYTYYHVLVNRS